MTDSDVTIVAFLIFPTKTKNHNVESLKGQALHKQLVYFILQNINEINSDTVNELKNKIGENLMHDISRLDYLRHDLIN